MLMEDQYGVGDVINIGDATGTVEAVSLRTTRLRDVNGVVWHIRNGAHRAGRQRVTGLGPRRGRLAGPARLDLPRHQEDHGAGRGGHVARAPLAQADDGEARGLGRQAITTPRSHAGGGQDLPLRQYEVGRELRERVVSAIDLALLDLQIDPQPGRTAAQLAAVGEERGGPVARTTMRSRTGHTGGDDPISARSSRSRRTRG